jgi:anti-sigma factor RsiW
VTEDAYVEYDGAYVLGALSPSEREEFESHLQTCPECRARVAELSDLPGPIRSFRCCRPPVVAGCAVGGSPQL